MHEQLPSDQQMGMHSNVLICAAAYHCKLYGKSIWTGIFRSINFNRATAIEPATNERHIRHSFSRHLLASARVLVFHAAAIYPFARRYFIIINKDFN